MQFALSRRSFLAAAAGLAAARAWASERLPVVATFSILADFVQRVGGDRIALTTLVGPGADAHVYSPSPADARALAGARLVFVNGLGFEGWVSRLIRSSGTKAAIVTAASLVRPIRAQKSGHGHAHGHDHGEQDPHAWQDVGNARLYVKAILAGFVAADPAGRAFYEDNARAYDAELERLDAEVREAIGRIPAERRKIITAHNAFAYFERAYGLDFISPRGVSTAAEPSPQAVARLIRQIRESRTPAVFLENITDPRLMKRIADETGARIGGTLHSDALTPPGGAAPTYVELMRHNARQLVGALAVS